MIGGPWPISRAYSDAPGTGTCVSRAAPGDAAMVDAAAIVASAIALIMTALFLSAAGRLRLHRVRERQPVLARDVADLQVVPIRRRRVIALERRGVDIVRHPRPVRTRMLARGVDLRAQPALLQL